METRTETGREIHRKVKAVSDMTLSRSGEERYVIIDSNTAEIVNDANGYGFTSVEKAAACHNNGLYHDFMPQKEIAEFDQAYCLDVNAYLKTHKEVLEIMTKMKRDFGKFNCREMNRIFAEEKIFLEFSAYELVSAWYRLQKYS